MIKNFLTRLYTSGIILIMFLAIFVTSFYPPIFEIAISLLIMICIYEAIHSSGMEDSKYYYAPCMIFGALFSFSLILKQYVFVNKNIYYTMIALTFVYLMSMLIVMLLNPTKCKFSNATSIMCITLLITCFLTNIIFSRRYNDHGFFYMVLAIMCSSWVTDIFAYLVGMLIGKHKFAPNVSPKKSIEGSVGGAVFSVAFFALFTFIYATKMNLQVNWWITIIYAVVCTVIGQIGDLSFSFIKRSFGIKDFGKILPGHGGFLDRLDSLIFISPIFYMMLNIKDIFIY